MNYSFKPVQDRHKFSVPIGDVSQVSASGRYMGSSTSSYDWFQGPRNVKYIPAMSGTDAFTLDEDGKITGDKGTYNIPNGKHVLLSNNSVYTYGDGLLQRSRLGGTSVDIMSDIDWPEQQWPSHDFDDLGQYSTVMPSGQSMVVWAKQSHTGTQTCVQVVVYYNSNIVNQHWSQAGVFKWTFTANDTVNWNICTSNIRSDSSKFAFSIGPYVLLMNSGFMWHIIRDVGPQSLTGLQYQSYFNYQTNLHGISSDTQFMSLDIGWGYLVIASTDGVSVFHDSDPMLRIDASFSTVNVFQYGYTLSTPVKTDIHLDTVVDVEKLIWTPLRELRVATAILEGHDTRNITWEHINEFKETYQQISWDDGPMVSNPSGLYVYKDGNIYENVANQLILHDSNYAGDRWAEYRNAYGGYCNTVDNKDPRCSCLFSSTHAIGNTSLAMDDKQAIQTYLSCESKLCADLRSNDDPAAHKQWTADGCDKMKITNIICNAQLNPGQNLNMSANANLQIQQMCGNEAGVPTNQSNLPWVIIVFIIVLLIIMFIWMQLKK